MFSKLKRKWKFFCQWIKWGFSDRDTIDLNIVIAEFVLPRLQRFKEVVDIAPEDFIDTGGECNDAGMMAWRNTIQQMIDAFEILANPDDSYYLAPEKQIIVDRGLALFTKYYENLWW